MTDSDAAAKHSRPTTHPRLSTASKQRPTHRVVPSLFTMMGPSSSKRIFSPNLSCGTAAPPPPASGAGRGSTSSPSCPGCWPPSSDRDSDGDDDAPVGVARQRRNTRRAATSSSRGSSSRRRDRGWTELDGMMLRRCDAGFDRPIEAACKADEGRTGVVCDCC